jgi:hypothetical protein
LYTTNISKEDTTYPIPRVKSMYTEDNLAYDHSVHHKSIWAALGKRGASAMRNGD